MALTFRGTHVAGDALLAALDAIADLVGSDAVAEHWDDESALPGMTVGGLTRHLVSQGETAVEFLGFGGVPPHAVELDLTDYYARVDWLLAGTDEPENTSIRDEFNAMAAVGPEACRQIRATTRGALPELLASAGPATYVPWQDCALATEDFLVCRLLEVVVHADDLAASVGVAGPGFGPDVLDPVVATLAVLAARRHGANPLLRVLSRSERAGAAAGLSAFG
jgi:hypothetical protein